MKQKIKIPEILKCAQCGADARLIDNNWIPMRHEWGFYVTCQNNHTVTRNCMTMNRAIHRWNHRNKLLGSE